MQCVTVGYKLCIITLAARKSLKMKYQAILFLVSTVCFAATPTNPCADALKLMLRSIEPSGAQIQEASTTLPRFSEHQKKYAYHPIQREMAIEANMSEVLAQVARADSSLKKQAMWQKARAELSAELEAQLNLLDESTALLNVKSELLTAKLEYIDLVVRAAVAREANQTIPMDLFQEINAIQAQLIKLEPNSEAPFRFFEVVDRETTGVANLLGKNVASLQYRLEQNEMRSRVHAVHFHEARVIALARMSHAPSSYADAVAERRAALIVALDNFIESWRASSSLQKRFPKVRDWLKDLQNAKWSELTFDSMVVDYGNGRSLLQLLDAVDLFYSPPVPPLFHY